MPIILIDFGLERELGQLVLQILHLSPLELSILLLCEFNLRISVLSQQPRSVVDFGDERIFRKSCLSGLSLAIIHAQL